MNAFRFKGRFSLKNRVICVHPGDRVAGVLSCSLQTCAHSAAITVADENRNPPVVFPEPINEPIPLDQSPRYLPRGLPSAMPAMKLERIKATDQIELPKAQTPRGPRNGRSALACVGLKGFRRGDGAFARRRGRKYLRESQRVSSRFYSICTQPVGEPEQPSSAQRELSVCWEYCDSTPLPKILVNRISHHCPTKFGDIRRRANRKNGNMLPYIARRPVRTVLKSLPPLCITSLRFNR